MVTWKPPKEIVFGEGKNRAVFPVKVVTLAEFQRELQEHFGLGRKNKVPRAVWCTDCDTLYLREDRRRTEGFRHDFLHELDHAYIDWRGQHFEP